MPDEKEISIDYDELIDRLKDDCGLNNLGDEVRKLSHDWINERDILRHNLDIDREITKRQFHSIMELINRLDDRLDNHMESQATSPNKSIDELKKWLREYMDSYILITNKKIKYHDKSIKEHKLEIFGNGKKGLRTEIETLKAKATLTIWLLGILLTGSGLSVVALIVWQMVGV